MFKFIDVDQKLSNYVDLYNVHIYDIYVCITFIFIVHTYGNDLKIDKHK